MEFSERLTFYLSAFALGKPFTYHQLEKLIQMAQQNQNTINIHLLLRLLMVAFETHSNLQHHPQIKKVEKILQILVPKVKFEEPIQYLASCDFEGYHHFCANSRDKQMVRTYMRSFGLYPVSYPGSILPASIFLRKTQGTVNGNTNWLFSRVALKEAYQVKCLKMSEQIKQIHLFLLSDQRLLQLWHNDPFKLLWGQLYISYNHLSLKPHCLDYDQNLKTWLRPTLNDTFSRIIGLQNRLSLDERLFYYLVMTIFSANQQYKQVIQFKPFQMAFNSFQKMYAISSNWHYLLALLLFSLIAKQNKCLPIAQQCSRKFKNMLLLQPYNIEKYVDFIYFLLPEQELITYIQDNKIQYWKIPLTEELKGKLAHHLLMKGIISPKTLKYIKSQTFKERVFKSAQLQSVQIGNTLINSLSTYQKQIILYLNEGQNLISKQQFEQNYQLFISTWSSYYQLFSLSTLELAESALIPHSAFDRKMQSMFTIPRDSSTAIYNILIGLSQEYQLKSQYPTSDCALLKQGKDDFQNKTLPNLLPLLNQQQRNQFWKQWNETQNNFIFTTCATNDI